MSPLPREAVFLHQRPKTEYITGPHRQRSKKTQSPQTCFLPIESFHRFEQHIIFKLMTYCSPNRPFPSSPGPLFQNEGRCSAFDIEVVRDGPLENWGGGGGGEFSACTNYFFCLLLVQEFFFRWTPLHEFFFFRQILLFFFNSEILIHTPYSQMADTREKTGA